MAMSRSFGGTRLTTRSPMRISPDAMFSRPAIMRSRVDLPHPDGPTSTTNSPSSMRTSTPWMTSIAPKAFLTSRIATEAMETPPVARPLAGAPLKRARGLFSHAPDVRAAMAGQDAGPAIGRDYRGNFNSPLLTNAPDPRREIPVSGAKTALASRAWRRDGDASPKPRAHSHQMERARAH